MVNVSRSFRSSFQTKSRISGNQFPSLSSFEHVFTFSVADQGGGGGLITMGTAPASEGT